MEDEEEKRCKDSSHVDTWVKVTVISLIVLILLFGFGTIAWMIRTDSAEQTETEVRHSVPTQTSPTISAGETWEAKTYGLPFKISWYLENPKAGKTGMMWTAYDSGNQPIKGMVDIREEMGARTNSDAYRFTSIQKVSIAVASEYTQPISAEVYSPHQ